MVGIASGILTGAVAEPGNELTQSHGRRLTENRGENMSSGVIIEIPRNRLARITGGLYLAFILAMFAADSVGHIGIGEVDQTYEVLTTDQGQFAVGLVFSLLSALLFGVAMVSVNITPLLPVPI